MRRARPVIVLAAGAFAAGVLLGAGHGASPGYALADRFVTAWTHGDYASMYADIARSSQHTVAPSEFAATYRQALIEATVTHVKITGAAHGGAQGDVVVPVTVDTRLFGALSLDFTLRTVADGTLGTRIAWSRSLAFPGLRPGELLSRDTRLPRRATLLARDGSVLAESPTGPDPVVSAEATRNSPLGNVAEAVVGAVGPAPVGRRQELEEQGVPYDASVGLSGLELAFDDRLRGIAGGELLAGSRVLAYAAPRPAPAVRTSVSPTLQSAAVTALGGQLGGIVALAPSTGQILAVAGIGLDGLQPPGSTFKMVTTTGVLEAKIATAHSVFPYATFATLDGVKLSNANGEECGGTLELAFAVSCNSVFTPLGVKLGAGRLVATAERFGFNRAPGITGASESTLPPASQIQGELDLGSTAIGQGQVLATPLEMATVAATIADGGRRPQPTFLQGHPAPRVSVTSDSVAHTMRRLMIGVVREGTGTSAAIPGVTVAGKTGTAELRSSAELKSSCASTASASESSSTTSPPPGKEGCQGSESEAANTDAWFAAFAPALDPRIVVCVMLVKDGAGGTTAAPVAREVLEAALQEH
ncbi:MAG TPA: penicillin-binding transpeptidase domain-containing protein [Solirubrobacteraceae bacterium]|jgi:cell division protein FtsI/penicillin-binding protein 2|nr:penicillin-binding transpeptidase domain-containing protein [Solirubrobacteraceae bacterium]